MSSKETKIAKTIAWSDGAAVVGSRQNLVVVRWDGPPSAAQLRALAAHADEVSRAHPEGVGLLSVIVDGKPRLRFDGAIREEVIRLSEQSPEDALAVAHVVLTRGLAGAAIRGILSAVLSVAKPRTPTRLFDAMEPAEEWVAGKLAAAGRWSPTEVAEAFASLDAHTADEAHSLVA